MPKPFPLVDKHLILDGIRITRRGQQQTQTFVKCPPLPTKTQLRTALAFIADIGGSEYSLDRIRKLTYILTQLNDRASPANSCRYCRSGITKFNFSEKTSPIWVEYCTKPGCRRVYVLVFKYGVYDCIAKKWL